MADHARHQRNIVFTASIAVLAGLAATIATVSPAAAAAPRNDSFTNSTQLDNSFGKTQGSNVGASKETGEPDHAGVLGNKSVWYSWTAPRNGPVTFRLDLSRTPDAFEGEIGLPFDSLLAAYRGDSVSALTEVVSNDDIGLYDWASRITFAAQSGTTYKIAVDGLGGKSGPFLLTYAMRPTNDNFSAQQNVSSSALVRNDNSLATNEVGEPSGQRRSVWYRWTAPRSGDVVFRTAGSLFDTKLSVYTGGTLATLTLRARNDDFAVPSKDFYTVTSRVRIPVRQGRTYRIAVSGTWGASGPMELRWRML